MRSVNAGYIVIVLVSLCILGSGCISVSSPKLPKAYSGPETFIEKTFPFTYDGNQYAVGVNISSRQIQESIWAKESIGDYNTTTDNIYFPAVVKDTKENFLYEDILYDLRYYRQLQKFDNDQYMEFLTAFVQSIPYEDQGDRLDPKLPVEVIVDGNGDCDDKTVLLSGLLYTEGYGVSAVHVHLSGDADHMGVGVKSNGAEYDNSGYMFVEVTNTTPVGFTQYTYYPSKFMPDFKDDADVAVAPPSIYVINEGGLSYSNGDTAEYVLSVIGSMRSQFDCWNEQIDDGDILTDYMMDQLDTYEAQVDEYEWQYKSDQISYCTYSYAYDRYENYYDRTDAAIAKYNRQVEEREQWRDLYNYLIDNSDSIGTQALRAHAWGDERGTSKISYCQDVWATERNPLPFFPKPCFEY